MKSAIFTSFDQLGKSSLKECLGLTISHELVRAMHGRTWVESEKGKGSTFYVALPCEKPT